MKERSDNNRGLHASSVVGDPRNAEGAVPINSLTAPGNLLGDPTEGRSRQDITSNGPRSQFDFQSGGENELLGQGTTDEGLTDDNYPSVPDPDLSGESGTKNAGDQGSPIDWGSVAPYRYPEYPAETLPQDKSGGLSNAVPLT